MWAKLILCSHTFYDSPIFVGNTVSAPGNANILVTKYQSDGNIAWQRTAGGQAGLNDYGVVLAIDNQNNSYVAAAMTTSGGFFDFAILKYDANGTLQWTATWDGANHAHDIPTAITLDDAGNVIVAGSTTSFTQQMNYAVVKFNSAGVRLWATTYDHVNLNDFPTAIQKTTNDNIVVTGASANAPNSWDYATILVNGSTGQVENVNRVNVPEIGLDQALAVTRDNQNNLFITGYTEKNGNKDIQVVKLNSNFGLEWVKSYDAGGLEDIAQSIECDGFGNVYVAGHSKTIQNGDAFTVLKYDTQGNLIWNQAYKPYTHDGAQAADLKVMQTGDFYLSGTIKKGNETDFATLKYSKDGQIEWERRFEGTGSDEAKLIKTDDSGNVYVTGISDNGGTKTYTTLKYTTFKPNNPIVYKPDGKPSHFEHELIVKFAPEQLNLDFVNDLEALYGEPETVLSFFAISEMERVLPFGMRDNPSVKFCKIFKRLTAADSLSITNSGDTIKLPKFWSALLFQMPNDADLEQTKNALNNLKSVIAYAELNSIATRDFSPDDGYYNSNQRGLFPNTIYPDADINAQDAWDLETGQPFVRCGVLDAGILWSHRDFSKTGSNTFADSKVRGYDYEFNTDIDLMNYTGAVNHGTSCAGIIGAITNNGQGTAGIAGGRITNNPSTSNSGVSLFSFASDLSDAQVADAVTEAAILSPTTGRGFFCHTLNCSYGYDNEALTVKDVFRTAFKNQVVITASRGNVNSNIPRFPATYRDEWVISTGGSGDHGHRWIEDPLNSIGSNFGNNMDLIAPATRNLVFTTKTNDNFAWYSFIATSAAAPHASGVAALVLSQMNNPNAARHIDNLSPEDVEYVLQKSAKDRNSPLFRDEVLGYDDQTGWGLLNAYNAVKMVDKRCFQIRHFTFNSTASAVPTFSNRQVEMVNQVGFPVEGTTTVLRSGLYNNVDIHQIDVTNNHTIPANVTLLDSWKRNSASNLLGFDNSTGQIISDLETDIQLVSFNRTQARLKGNVYHFKRDLNNQPIDIWIPFNPFTGSERLKFAYSLYTKITNCTNGVNDVTESKGYSVNIFPNPASNNATLYFASETPSNVEYTIFDVQGRKVSETYKSNLNQGVNVFDLNLSDFVQGLYVIQFKTKDSLFYKKMVISK